MARCALVLLIGATAGCNQLLGLDPTERADEDAAVDEGDAASTADARDGCDPRETADEDSDGIPDSCDPCPHLGGLQGDSDEDGVGDACDPQDGRDDDILFFDGFSDGDNGGWVTVRGLWDPSDGMFVQTDAVNPSALVYHPIDLPLEATVWASIDVLEPHVQPLGVAVQIYALDFAQGEPDGYECRVAVNGGGLPTLDVIAWAKAAPTMIGTIAYPEASYDIGSHFELRFRHNTDGELHCTASQDKSSADTVTTDLTYSDGGIALRTVNTYAGYRYVVAIGPARGGGS